MVVQKSILYYIVLCPI